MHVAENSERVILYNIYFWNRRDFKKMQCKRSHVVRNQEIWNLSFCRNCDDATSLRQGFYPKSHVNEKYSDCQEYIKNFKIRNRISGIYKKLTHVAENNERVILCNIISGKLESLKKSPAQNFPYGKELELMNFVMLQKLWRFSSWSHKPRRKKLWDIVAVPTFLFRVPRHWPIVTWNIPILA